MNKRFVITATIFLSLSILTISYLSTPRKSLATEPTWATTTLLPYDLSSHTSFSAKNKVFVINGSAITGQSKSDVLTAVPATDGKLSSWTSTSAQTPTALLFHSLTNKENLVYILGGKEENPGSSLSHVNKVFLGVVNDNGNISSWSSVTSLPKALSLGGTAIVGNRLYYAGGFNQIEINQKVYFTNINSDGTIGQWQEAGMLPEPMEAFGMVSEGNNLIIIGGHGKNSGFLKKTYKASVNTSNGTISNWQESSSLPEPVARGGVVKVGSHLFVVGGTDGSSNFSNRVYYAKVNNNGTLGTWKLSDYKLPQPVCCGGIASNGTYIYLTGGFNGGYLNTVYYAKAEDIIDPQNNNTDLDVPYFSQNALPWGPTEYDHTNSLGVTGNNASMDRWGCAVTSVAMILNYHGITEFPDGTVIDPGSLNKWLKNNKGYSYGINKEGWYSGIIWGSVSKLTKELYDAGKASMKLEHNRLYPSAITTAILNDGLLARKTPAILFVKNKSTDGHFVVAKGIIDDIYRIHDPEWAFPDLKSFNNKYTQVDRYVPSQTDLSYIQLTVNGGIEILLTNAKGEKTGSIYKNNKKESYNEIQDASYQLELPVSNPDSNGKNATLGNGFNLLLYPKPQEGDYTITLSSNKNIDYEMNIAVYEVDGDNSLQKTSGILDKNAHDTFSLTYNHFEASEFKKTITIDQLIEDIKEGQKIKWIQEPVAVNLIELARNAKKDFTKKQYEQLKIKLETFKKLLEELNGKGLNNLAYEILMYDINFLLNSTDH